MDRKKSGVAIIDALGEEGITPEFRLSVQDFEYLRQLIYDLSGIHLKDAKRQMVQSRLTKRLRILEMANFPDYIKYMKQHPEELTDMLNRITTNKTHFFREPKHFQFLQDAALPYILAAKQGLGNRTINGWCAASSTGEEPYTIAMVVQHFLSSHPGWSARLLASDLDTNVLAKASAGTYPKDVIKGIPGHLSKAYTCPVTGSGGSEFTFHNSVRNLLMFRQINLMSERYPIRSALDFIFCRNVFIYFTREDRDQVVKRFIKLLRPGGYLFLGHSEVLDVDVFGGQIEFIGNTTYQKVGS
ncbi:MAG: CheR family methyltransferase [Leptospirillia bacterium]